MGVILISVGLSKAPDGISNVKVVPLSEETERDPPPGPIRAEAVDSPSVSKVTKTGSGFSVGVGSAAGGGVVG
jgi:hypothetical protein